MFEVLEKTGFYTQFKYEHAHLPPTPRNDTTYHMKIIEQNKYFILKYFIQAQPIC